MSPNLLVTKLFVPPSRPNLVSRPHLVQKLNEGMQPIRRLTLVSAPAGYGKTTLVAGWLRGLQTRSAWLSLDEGDNDPVRFLTYLIAALEQAIGRFSENAQAMLQSFQSLLPEAVLTALVNDTAAVPEIFILVLDDYHVIHNPAIHQLLAFMLERQPTHMHLTLITHEDPLLPLSRFAAPEDRLLRFGRMICVSYLRSALISSNVSWGSR